MWSLSCDILLHPCIIPSTSHSQIIVTRQTGFGPAWWSRKGVNHTFSLKGLQRVVWKMGRVATLQSVDPNFLNAARFGHAILAKMRVLHRPKIALQCSDIITTFQKSRFSNWPICSFFWSVSVVGYKVTKCSLFSELPMVSNKRKTHIVLHFGFGAILEILNFQMDSCAAFGLQCCAKVA